MKRLALLIAALIAPVTRADAAYIITLSQVADANSPIGTDVVATGAGSLNITGLTGSASTILQPQISPLTGTVELGALGTPVRILNATFSPATAFAVGPPTPATSGLGDGVGFIASATSLNFFVPGGYVSGAALTSSSTFASVNLAVLGLAPGFSFTYGYSATPGRPDARHDHDPGQRRRRPRARLGPHARPRPGRCRGGRVEAVASSRLTTQARAEEPSGTALPNLPVGLSSRPGAATLKSVAGSPGNRMRKGATMDDGFEVVDGEPLRLRGPGGRAAEALGALLDAGIEVDWLGDDSDDGDRFEIELPPTTDPEAVRAIVRDLDDRF